MDSDSLSPPGSSYRESAVVESLTVDFDYSELVTETPMENLEVNEVFPNIGEYRIQPIRCFHSEEPKCHRCLTAGELICGKLRDTGEKANAQPDAQHLIDPSRPQTESKIVENFTDVSYSMEPITLGNPVDNSAVREVTSNTDRCHQKTSERHRSFVSHERPPQKLSDYDDKFDSFVVSQHEIGNPDSTETAGMIELNVLGKNPSNIGVFPCETLQEYPPSVMSTSAQNSFISINHPEVPSGPVHECPISNVTTSTSNFTDCNNQSEVLREPVRECPLSVLSTSAQVPARSKNKSEVFCDIEVKMPSSKNYGTNGSVGKTCDKAVENRDICKIEDTPLSVVNVPELSPDDVRLISDNDNLPDDIPRQTSSQDYGRVGDDLGGGQDREDMSMSHPGNSQQGSQVIPDEAGNLRILVRKTKPLLGIAIEGGANTRHPLPRIININENGAAYDAGGLQVGQLILEVDGQKVEGMHHQEVARLIAESFAQRDKPHIEFLVVEAKKSNLEPKPTALIFLEA